MIGARPPRRVGPIAALVIGAALLHAPGAIASSRQFGALDPAHAQPVPCTLVLPGIGAPFPPSTVGLAAQAQSRPGVASRSRRSRRSGTRPRHAHARRGHKRHRHPTWLNRP